MDAYNIAIRLKGDDVPSYLGRAGTRYMLGDITGAIADYSKAIELKPTDATAFTYRGFAKTQTADWAGADSDYSEALRLNPKLLRTLGLREVLNDMRGNTDAVKSDAETASHIEPGTAIDYVYRGLTRIAVRDQDGAMADIANAIQRDPNCQYGYVAQGYALEWAEDFGAATAIFSKALELKPNDAGALGGMGFVTYDQQMWEESLTWFQKAARMDRAFAYWPLRIALLQLRLGRPREAQTELAALARHLDDVNGLPFHKRLVSFLQHRMSETDLLASVQSDTTISPTVQRCCLYFYIGTWHIAHGDRAGANRFFQRCIETNETEYHEYKSAQAELRSLK